MVQRPTLTQSRFLQICPLAALFVWSVWTNHAGAQTMEVVITHTAIPCNGGMSTATVSVTGNGQPPFSYIWSNGLTTQNVGLPAGTHSVIVLDTQGRTGTDTVTITEPAALGVAIVTEQQICALAPDGSATAVPFGGTPPYSYSWSNGGNTAQITGLAAGPYAVTVTDANNCTSSGQGEVEYWDEGLWIMLTPKDVLCHGDSTGSIKVSPMSGTPPYTYIWNTGDTTETVTNLPAGAYSVTVNDINGCENSMSGDIFEPAPLSLSLNSFGDFGCEGIACASAVPGGGTVPYSILWNTGSDQDTICGLATGRYAVTLTDANLCTLIGSIQIIKADSLNITIDVTGCAGCTILGSAVATAGAGSGTFSFQWDNGETTPTADSLPAGPHTVTITDLVNGCTDTATVHISSCPLLTVDVQTDSPATCLENGQATTNVSGGVPPFTIIWDNGENGATADSLQPGVHTVSVTDSVGCIVVDTLNMGIVPFPEISIQVTSCAGCTIGGSAAATVTAGSGNYRYEWDNGDTATTADSLAAGPHTLIVTDLITGCKDTATVNILVCAPLQAGIQIDSLATCLTGGRATANVSGGQAPYTIQWDNGQTGPTAVGLSSGSHTVTITDASGCVLITNFTMGQTPNPDVSASVLAHVTCGGGGSAQAFPGGGLPPYFFFWDNGDTTAVADSLSPGLHCVTLTDSNGCADTACVTINPSPNAPVVTVAITSPATCLSGATMEATIVSGGVPPFTFLWSNGDTTAVADSLPAGIHCVTVTDSLGCSNIACDTVDVPVLPAPVAAIITPAGCLTGATAAVSPSGGIPPYTYLWMPGNFTTAVVSNLSPGNYTITATDANGCSGTTTLHIAAPTLPVLSAIYTTKQTCNMFATAGVTASGGTPPYFYEWENGETGPDADSLIAGNHFVIVTDAAGCRDTALVSVFFTPNGIALGDFVWYDNDQDGIQDAQETDGVSNIVVRLTQAGPDGIFGTADDVTLARDTTGPDGEYRFECIVPGNYVLAFTGLPFGFQWASKNQSNDDCLDSDVNVNGRTDVINVLNVQSDNLCIDVGVHLICQNVINAGLVCCNQTICQGDVPGLLNQVAPPFGGQGPLEFQWLRLDQSGPGQPIWMDIPGATGPNYQPGPLTQTSYFMRRARRGGCIQYLESNVITITVLPAGSPGCGSFLKDFTVQALDNLDIRIDWVTLPELVQFIYTVEHSPDQVLWRAVNTLIGNYNALSDNTYSTIHHTPVRGINYYRIKRVDPFGLVSYSEIRSVDLNLSFRDAVLVYPNPASDVLTIRNLASFESEITVELIAPNGAVVNTYVIPRTALTVREIPVGLLASGLYFVRITFENGDRRTVKISKF
jgi:hypothetical protein